MYLCCVLEIDIYALLIVHKSLEHLYSYFSSLNVILFWYFSLFLCKKYVEEDESNTSVNMNVRMYLNIIL